jgi:hypothetical protein
MSAHANWATAIGCGQSPSALRETRLPVAVPTRQCGFGMPRPVGVCESYQDTKTGYGRWRLSPEGDYLASGSEDRTMRLWRTAQRSVSQDTPREQQLGVVDVAFSPQGDTLVSGHGDRRVQVWDVASGDCLQTLLGAEKAIWSVTFSPQGNLLASGNEDGNVRLWEQPCWRTLTKPCRGIPRRFGQWRLILRATYSGQRQRRSQHSPVGGANGALLSNR